MIEAETETGIIEIERTEDHLEDGTMMIEETETEEEVADITEMMTEETEENPDGAEMMTEEIVIAETDPRQMLAADSRTWRILCLCSTCQIFQNLRQETGDLVSTTFNISNSEMNETFMKYENKSKKRSIFEIQFCFE